MKLLTRAVDEDVAILPDALREQYVGGMTGTITPSDVKQQPNYALTPAEIASSFDNYVEPLKVYLHKFREIEVRSPM